VIGDGTQLYRQLVDNAVQYFTSERDGPDVDSAVLDRQPANLTDEHAYVYADPSYDSNDNLLGTLKKIGGPVNVAGGWFDAGGGYEKFAYTASYSDALMLIAARALSHQQGPNANPDLLREADFGLQWKLWNPVLKVLYAQVGIALADEATGAPARRLNADLATAARWARAYIAQGHPAGGDTFNLYDNGAVAEAELLQAMQQAGTYPIAPGTLLGDLAAQLRTGEDQAKGDPFALGTQLGASDASPHAFGLFITDALYRKYGGSGQYSAFAQQQLNFALGANAWGSSFVVGAGTVFPHCMQSEIANLAGSLTGSGDIQLGATTDGPSSIGNFSGLGTVPGMRACSAGNFAPFNTAAAGYEDNVVSWPSVEPAADYTAASLFAFALGQAGLG
jgi:Glycosyl hydrolase family 9